MHFFLQDFPSFRDATLGRQKIIFSPKSPPPSKIQLLSEIGTGNIMIRLPAVAPSFAILKYKT
jgi:hypothetical protein